MSWTIRRLHLPADFSLYHTMYTWLVESPSWRQETEAIFGTLDWEAYMAAAQSPGRCDIGIFEDSQLIATVILTLTAKDTYEVHFEASPTARWETVVVAGERIRDMVFEIYGARLVYTWTPRWNRGVMAINKAIGFAPDYVTMFKGTCRGRLVEWARYSIVAGG